MNEYMKCKKFVLKELTADMIESIAKATKLTQSQVLQQLLFDYTLDYWSNPEAINERWINWVNKKNGN